MLREHPGCAAEPTFWRGAASSWRSWITPKPSTTTARIRGQRKLSARWATYIRYLNHAIAGVDAEAAGYADAPPAYAPPLSPGYVPPASGGYPSTGYGAHPYGTSPLNGVVSSLLGPMLGTVP